MADETESIGQSTSFERLLLAAIVVHLMAKGICPTSQNMCKAYNVIYRITSMFPFLELPLFKRSLQLFSSYILTVQKTIFTIWTPSSLLCIYTYIHVFPTFAASLIKALTEAHQTDHGITL